MISPHDIVMTASLQAAIETAYVVFAPYHTRFSAHVCQCPSCFSKADRERLLTTPLRLIDGKLLDQYSWSAHGHDDDGPRSDDLRYLLPRYFDLFAHNDPALHDSAECVLSQLGRTPFRTAWPAAEVEAIDGYFDALLRACLANGAIASGWRSRGGEGYHCALRMDRVVTMLIRAGADIARLLDAWSDDTDPSAALHLADLRYEVRTDVRGTRLSNPHLERDFIDAAMAVGAFVTSPAATALIEAAFFRSADSAAQRLLSDALFLG